MKNHIYLLVWGILLVGFSAVAMYTEEGERLEHSLGLRVNLDILGEYFPSYIAVRDPTTKKTIPLNQFVQDKVLILNKMFEQKYGKSDKNIYQAIFQFLVENYSFMLQYLRQMDYLASLGKLYGQRIDINKPLIGSQVTPLEHAVDSNNLVLVKFLLDKGASVLAAVFQAAQKSKNPEILKLIFESTKEAR